MFKINALDALEILDSRGRPTLKVACTLASGLTGFASVPSGASTGVAEAFELRDGDSTRYGGLGCKNAAANVKGEIFESVRNGSFSGQEELDLYLIELDGSPRKSRLGANALLGVSLAFARACALEEGVELFHYFGELVPRKPATLPRLAINLFSGGKHAGGQVAIQDVLLVPLSSKTINRSLSMAYDVYRCAADLVSSTYGSRALVADEGGLAPDFEGTEQMLGLAVAAIEQAGLEPKIDIALAVDVASSHFFKNGMYYVDGATLDSDGMIDRLSRWVSNYPILSIEDGLAEEDWAGWTELTRRINGTVRVVGDDLLCTSCERLEKAIVQRAVDTLLLKVNQIGTLTEACAALRMARKADFGVIASARSGETEDCWLADLAVGWGADQIKIGSITRSERLAKYNRLLEIEGSAGWPLAPVRAVQGAKCGMS